ncbi:hypothetical protein ABIF50_004617 [Bradyrhizobium diazoefficiens]
MTSVIDAAPAKPAFRLTRAFQGLERVVVPALLIAGWEAFARSGMLPTALLPAPSAVLHALGDWVFGFDETTQTYSGHWLRRCARQRSSRLRRLCAGKRARHSRWRRHRLVAPVREDAGADAADAAADPAGVLDSAGHHLVRHRRQARDLPRLPRRLLSRADEQHSRGEDRGPQSRACRRDDGRKPAADVDRYRAAGGAALDLRRPAHRGRIGLDADGHGRDGRGEERPRLRPVGFLLLPALRHRACRDDLDRAARLSLRPRPQGDHGAHAALAADDHRAGQGRAG